MTTQENAAVNPDRAVVWIARVSVAVSAFYALASLGQLIMLSRYFPSGAFAVPEGTPALTAWVITHTKAVNACAFVFSAAALVSSLGLLWRKSWAVVPYAMTVGGLTLFVAGAGLAVLFSLVPTDGTGLRFPLALVSVLVAGTLIWALKKVLSCSR